MRPGLFALLLAGVSFALLLLVTPGAPGVGYPTYVLAVASATVGGLWLARIRPTSRSMVAAGVALGLLVRAGALGLDPVFSDDVFRYVYEGRLSLWGGPALPFRHPPSDGPTLGVPGALLDDAWRRVNHPELATIYPPLAQALFAAGAGLGDLLGGRHLLAVTGLLVAIDLLGWRLLHRRDPSAGWIWALSPLVVLETGREGHVDVVSAVGLALFALGFGGHRPRLGWLGIAVSATAKLNGLVLAPLALRSCRRGAALLVPTLALIAVPYQWAASADTSGLAAYATRWRAGDGAFGLLLALAEAVLGGDWARLDGLGVTVTRHELARAGAALAFAGVYLAVLLRPHAFVGALADRSSAGRGPDGYRDRAARSADPGGEGGAPALGGFLLLVLLLLSPTLHPWYVLWLVPFVALTPFPGRTAAIWLMLTAGLLHHPSWLELVEGTWRDLPALRALVHVPAWALLARDLWRWSTGRQTSGEASPPKP